MKFLMKCAIYSFILSVAGPLWAQNPTASVQEIMDRMMARNAWQDQTLLEFRANRKFYAANIRFKTDATMYVQTVFRRPDQLQSTVTSHVGSNLIRSRVFDKIPRPRMKREPGRTSSKSISFQRITTLPSWERPESKTATAVPATT